MFRLDFRNFKSNIPYLVNQPLGSFMVVINGHEKIV